MTVPGTVQLPGIEWLLIHGQPGGLGTITLLRTDSDDQAVDAEGRVSSTATPTSVRGYASSVGEAEIAWAGSIGVEATAVVALPRGTGVDETDGLELLGVDPYLDGRYTITAVRSTPVHLRVLCERMVDLS